MNRTAASGKVFVAVFVAVVAVCAAVCAAACAAVATCTGCTAATYCCHLLLPLALFCTVFSSCH